MFLSLIVTYAILPTPTVAGDISVPLQIPISGAGSIEVCVGEKCAGIAKYISLVYQWLVGFAAVLAVLALTWGGVRWLTSGGESGKIQEAQKVIGNAIIGLLIALLSYAGLYLINPALTQFNPLTVKPIKPIPLSIVDLDGGGKDGGFTNTCIDDYHKLNPDIKYSATAEDVFKQLDARIKDKCYWTHSNKGESFADDIATLVHENVHKLNDREWLYLGGGEYVSLTDPFDGSSGRDQPTVSNFIPPIFKTINPSFLETYISATRYKNVPPFHLLDELSAYILDNRVQFEVDEKKYQGEISAEIGTERLLMMMVYNLALARMIEDKEAAYLTTDDGNKYKNSLRGMIEETMELYAKYQRGLRGVGAVRHEGLEEGNRTYNALKTHPEAEKLRKTAKRLFNAADKNWTNRVLGF